MASLRYAKVLTLVFVAASATACGDPVRDDVIDSLGGEKPGVGPGPTHRPGQPCLVCHGPGGPQGPTFIVAGTVFRSPHSCSPLSGAIVRIVDANDRTFAFRTNRAGNFYVGEGSSSPAFPFWVTVESGGQKSEMKSRVLREGSCAGCHWDPPSNETMGHVYFADENVALPFAECR